MKILLIGTFAPSYEEESLHNISLYKRLTAEGHSCSVINISHNPSIEKGISDNNSYVGFILKVIRLGFGKDAIHFLTKGYTRPGLMKMVTAAFLGRLMFADIFITLHPELFSVFGQLRSKMGGQQLLHLSFSFAKKVICGDRHTYDVASLHYKAKDKFSIIPTAVMPPAEASNRTDSRLEKIKDKKRVLLFSNMRFPSLAFNILSTLLTKYLTDETGVIISFAEKFSSKLEHVINETGSKLSGNIIFIGAENFKGLSLAYSAAHMVIRPLSCDGKTLFTDIAVCMKRPSVVLGDVIFPLSFTLVKEGDVTEICSHLMNEILTKDLSPSAVPDSGDVYSKIEGIYSGMTKI
ncbi:MAG: glycosyltransferase [Nitrospirae bacterium]|nr:glycosyltransferase [Nitrospirota bacterium]